MEGPLVKYPREFVYRMDCRPPLSHLNANSNSPLVYPLLTRVLLFYPRYCHPFKNS